MSEMALADQPYDAHQLRLQGLSWPEIAERTGYKDAKTAQVGVRGYLQRASLNITEEHRKEALNLELQRLDALQGAIWPQAMAGDVRAVEGVLKVMKTRHGLLGFEQADTSNSTRTLVIAGDKDEFVAALQAIA
jgi:hypothetical protein